MKKTKKKAESCKITDDYEIVKIAYGFRLDYSDPEKKNDPERKTFRPESKFYGVLHHALKGFVNDYIGRFSTDVDDIIVKVEEANRIIEALNEKISDEWKVVKVVRG
jgi:hypothetical protein